MIDTTELVGSYIAAWNETNPARRQSLIARTWALDACYVDPMMESDGHAGIDAMIRAAYRNAFPGLSIPGLAGAIRDPSRARPVLLGIAAGSWRTRGARHGFRGAGRGRTVVLRHRLSRFGSESLKRDRFGLLQPDT